MSNLTRTADYLTEVLEQDGFVIMSERGGQGLPLVAFRFKNAAEGGKDRHYDEFALAHHLRSRGWVVPAYTMAPHTEGLKMLRVVVREDFSKSRCDMLIHDLRLCVGLLDSADAETIKRQEAFIRDHVASHGKSKHQARHHASKHYQVSFKSFDYTHSFWILCLGADRIISRARATPCRASMARHMPSAKKVCWKRKLGK
jgi:glutamate decarboxylase